MVWAKKSWETPLDTKVIKIIVLRKFSANNFALSDAEGNISGPSNRGGKVDLLLWRTLLAIQQNSCEPIFREMIDSFSLLAQGKFGTFKNFFVTIASLSELDYRYRRIILSIQMK